VGPAVTSVTGVGSSSSGRTTLVRSDFVGSASQGHDGQSLKLTRVP